MSAVCFVAGAALVALRLRGLGFSSPDLVASVVPRNYAFGIGLHAAVGNAPIGLIAYVVIGLGTRWQMSARIWRVGLALWLVGALVVVLIGRTWSLLVVAGALAAVWIWTRRAPSSSRKPPPARGWSRVALAVAITAAFAIAKEADQISTLTVDQAVVVFRDGLTTPGVLGLQLHDKRRVKPDHQGTDPLCEEERTPHICGLLLSLGGDGVTIASLAFSAPRIVVVPQDDIASVFIVPADLRIADQEKTYRRVSVGCRIWLLRRLGCGSAS